MRGGDRAWMIGHMRTILVVGDHAGFRTYATAFLAACGFRVVGEAADGRAALEASSQLRPDVILLDIQLPDIDGFEVARQVLAEPDRPTIILTSTRDAQDYGRRIEESGAAGFVTKARLTAVALREILG